MRCKNCKEKFEPTSFLQNFCMIKDECIQAFLATIKKKNIEDYIKSKNKITYTKKAKKKSNKELLQDQINLISRLIDWGTPCMMCDNPVMKRINGCHYHAVGGNSSLRYNLFNVWHGCNSCNGHKGGNIIGYDNQLIKYYGRDFWEHIKFDLVRKNQIVKLSDEELKEKISIARKIVKELKQENKQHTLKERVELRKKYNKEIGIYD